MEIVQGDAGLNALTGKLRRYRSGDESGSNEDMRANESA
jgi:hypothetical protein